MHFDDLIFFNHVEPEPSKDALVEHLQRASKILVFTGAGISTGSGIPDFRGPHGVWKSRQPVYYQEFMASEAKRIEHWQFKLEGWEGYRDAQPNVNHSATVELEKAGKLLMVVTQNIDGLHSKAGTDRKRLVELHGTNTLVECQSCKTRSDPEPHFKHFGKTQKPPRCECGGFLKPATISFGQEMPLKEMARASRAAEEADLCLALGSSLSVYPASEIPLEVARRGVPYIIINRGPTDQDDCAWVTLRIEGAVEDHFPPAVGRALGG